MLGKYLSRLWDSPVAIVFIIVAIALCFALGVVYLVERKQAAWEAWVQPVCGTDVVLRVEHYGIFDSSRCYTITCGNVAEKSQHAHIKCE